MAKNRDFLAEALGIEPNPNFSYDDNSVDETEIIGHYVSAWKGNKHTEESKYAIGKSNRGKKRTPEAKEKMRLAKLGKKRGAHSDEHKRRLSESLRRFGPHSETRRKNQSIAAKRRYQNEKAN